MTETTTIFDRTLAPLRRAIFGDRQEAAGSKDLNGSRLTDVRARIDDCLSERGGEVSARVRASELGQLYLQLGEEGRQQFLRLLADEYGVDLVELDAAMASMHAARNDEERYKGEQGLRNALVPPRLKLLRQFNALPEGVKFLVDMRADLLPLARKDARVRALDEDFRYLLASWFDIGFLEMRRIDWDSPAALLEKLIAYEAVHEIKSWDDLKNRLDSDRRCFAFFHPRMPAEPLIFVEVALVRGMADNVLHLLDESAPEQDLSRADTAIFYSISNCQTGLAGVSFGNFLIKRVVDELSHELPNLKTFATLSPVPGFRRWFLENLPDMEDDFWQSSEVRELTALAGKSTAAEAVAELVGREGWPSDTTVAETLRPVLVRACAKHLTTSRADGTALNRVAHFHLSNGARLERINWLGDESANGMRQSFGLMVNYLYRLGDIERNHESYTASGKIAVASSVRKLV
jgi:malonyl-CoA decarboxylase